MRGVGQDRGSWKGYRVCTRASHSHLSQWRLRCCLLRGYLRQLVTHTTSLLWEGGTGGSLNIRSCFLFRVVSLQFWSLRQCPHGALATEEPGCEGGRLAVSWGHEWRGPVPRAPLCICYFRISKIVLLFLGIASLRCLYFYKSVSSIKLIN